MDEYKNLFDENKKDLEKTLITLSGGYGDGSTFNIPNGVKELTVESPFGDIKYIRDETKPEQFIPWRG